MFDIRLGIDMIDDRINQIDQTIDGISAYVEDVKDAFIIYFNG